MKNQEKSGDEQMRRFEELQRRHKKLDEERVRVEERVKQAEKVLEQLRREAEQEFGTSDPDKLRDMLERMRRDNEEKIAAYEAHLAGIEQGLEELDRADETDAAPEGARGG